METNFYFPRIVFLGAVLLALILVYFSASKPFPEHQASIISTIAPPAPDIQAQAFLVKIIGDEIPLLKQREWKRMAPASLTKVLTSLIAYQQLSASDTVLVTIDDKKIEPKISHAFAGEKFYRDDAIRIALMESDNDMAYALAEAVASKRGLSSYGERIDYFVSLMNESAAKIGMNNSHFQNPAGLDDSTLFSTPNDLEILAEYVYKNYPQIWGLTDDEKFQVVSVGGHAYDISNTDPLLAYFPDLMGSKTGFTDDASGTLLLLYQTPKGKESVTVIMRSQDRIQDGKNIIEWLKKYF